MGTSGDPRVRDAERGRSGTFLIVHSSDELYGSDRMVLEVLEALPTGVRERVLVWLPSDLPHGPAPLCDRLSHEGVHHQHVDLPVLRRRYLSGPGLAATGRRALTIRSRLSQVDPSTVLLATSAVLPMAPILGSHANRRVVLHLQEIWEGAQGRALGVMAGSVDHTIAISEAARASLPERLASRAVVVPNSTPDPGGWTPVTREGGPLVFLMASRWMPWKGHEVLLQAWDAAGSPGKLLILGGPPPMGTAADVRAMVSAAARPDTIEVVGEVPDPDPYLRRADVMIVPSVRPEPFGLVTIEAFARGRPVIGSANGGLLETIADGAGWLVRPGDPRALAYRLSTLSRADVATAGIRARGRYESHYSRPAFADGLRAALGFSARDE